MIILRGVCLYGLAQKVTEILFVHFLSNTQEIFIVDTI